jgi:hypothetical protein
MGKLNWVHILIALVILALLWHFVLRRFFGRGGA